MGRVPVEPFDIRPVQKKHVPALSTSWFIFSIAFAPLRSIRFCSGCCWLIESIWGISHVIRDAVATSLPAVNNRNGTILGPLRSPRMKLREIFAVVFNVLANDRTGVLRRSRSTSAQSSLEQRLWFRRRQNFLETRIVPQWIPFPALSQV